MRILVAFLALSIAAFPVISATTPYEGEIAAGELRVLHAGVPLCAPTDPLCLAQTCPQVITDFAFRLTLVAPSTGAAVAIYLDGGIPPAMAEIATHARPAVEVLVHQGNGCMGTLALAGLSVDGPTRYRVERLDVTMTDFAVGRLWIASHAVNETMSTAADAVGNALPP